MGTLTGAPVISVTPQRSHPLSAEGALPTLSWSSSDLSHRRQELHRFLQRWKVLAHTHTHTDGSVDTRVHVCTYVRAQTHIHTYTDGSHDDQL